MCGIAGIVGRIADRSEKIVAMASALSHRGPDDCGYYRDEQIALGHRRLAINDLFSGHQPIANETDDLILVCNGEIYNSPMLRTGLIQRGHRFRSTTDIEVILHLYEELGVDCVKQLEGMFAFALWDSREGSLMLARDHLGQKPLFYQAGANGLVFASEIKAIIKASEQAPQIEYEGLWHYMSMRYLPDGYTLFRGIEKLPAGTWMQWHEGRIRKQQYWSLTFHPKRRASAADLEDELDQRIRAAVSSHMLSDVRVGGFLSGGIDSSMILAIMAQRSDGRVPSFSIGVEDDSFDELPFARQVVGQYGLEGHERVVHADLMRLVPRMIWHLEEPADPYGVGVYLASSLAAEHVKVVLTGDGGDESFGGYDRFAGQRLADYYAMLPQWMRKHVLSRLASRIPESFGYKSLGQRVRWLDEMSRYPSGERYARSLSTLRFSLEAKERLFSGSIVRRIPDPDSDRKILDHFNAANAVEMIDRMLYTDLMTRLPDHLLTMADRMSMAHSLETRAPFVDSGLVEFAATIPSALKVKGLRLKVLLRKVAARYLPTELVWRKKQGFAFPVARWLRSDLGRVLDGLLARSRFVEIGVFDPTYIDGLVAEHRSGRVDHNYRLWMLLNLELFHRIHLDGESLESVNATIEEFAAPATASCANVHK